MDKMDYDSSEEMGEELENQMSSEVEGDNTDNGKKGKKVCFHLSGVDTFKIAIVHESCQIHPLHFVLSLCR